MNQRLYAAFLLAIGFSAAAVLGVVTAGCKKRGEGEPLTRAETYNSFAKGLIYFRDPRSDLCFAYFYEQRAAFQEWTGGPALATVDCAKVGTLLENSPFAEVPTISDARLSD